MRRDDAESSARGGVAGKNFSEVEGRTAGQLRDLLAATEAVGDEDRRRAGGLHGGKQALVGDRLRNFQFADLKAERARHPATAGRNEIDRCSGRAEKRDFTGQTAKDGFLMAMTMD